MSKESIIIACSSCKAKNRIPLARTGENPVCAKCKAPLSGIPFHTVNATDSDFEKKVLQHKGPVLVDCWAPWCGPCRSIGPILDDLAKDFAGQIKIVKINMDENPGISSKYSIMSIPTMLFFKDGQLKDSLTGALPKTEIVKRIKSFI